MHLHVEWDVLRLHLHINDLLLCMTRIAYHDTTHTTQFHPRPPYQNMTYPAATSNSPRTCSY